MRAAFSCLQAGRTDDGGARDDPSGGAATGRNRITCCRVWLSLRWRRCCDDWNDEMDIVGWLQAIGLRQYEDVFRANAIDLEILPELSEADLEKLGVLLGHRKRMLRAVADL